MGLEFDLRKVMSLLQRVVKECTARNKDALRKTQTVAQTEDQQFVWAAILRQAKQHRWTLTAAERICRGALVDALLHFPFWRGHRDHPLLVDERAGDGLGSPAAPGRLAVCYPHEADRSGPQFDCAVQCRRQSVPDGDERLNI